MTAFVKICGLRDAATVAVAAEAGADAVGFVFAESVRCVTPAAAREAAAAAPAGVKRVAVMRHPANAEWLEVLDGFEPDVLQTDAADFAALTVPDSIERWPVHREGERMPAIDGLFLYEGPVSGSGRSVAFSRAAELACHGRMILAGGLTPDNVAAAIRQVRPFGVDVSSGVESAPGQKDAKKIRRFIDAVHAVEAVV